MKLFNFLRRKFLELKATLPETSASELRKRAAFTKVMEERSTGWRFW